MDWQFIDDARTLFESYGGLKTLNEAADLAKKVRDLVSQPKKPGQSDRETEEQAARLRVLLIDMQNAMFAAREESTELKGRLQQLVAELERLREFDLDRAAYQKVEPFPGSFAYRRSDGTDPGYKCAHCFEQSKRLVSLQIKEPRPGRDTLICTVCKSEVFQRNDRSATRPRGVTRSSYF